MNRQNKFTGRSIVIVLVIMSLLLSIGKIDSAMAQSGTAQSENPLFRETKAISSLPLSADTVRSRYVELNLTALRGMDGDLSSQSLVGKRVLLNLFPDVSYEMIIDSVGTSPSGGNAWNGHIHGVALSYVYIIYTREGVFAAHIASPQGIYEVQYAGEKLYVIKQIDQSLYGDDVVLEPKMPAPLLPAVERDTNSLLATTIDVMVVYTANAVSAVGGTSAMNAKIDLAVQEANQSYINSNVNISLNLVHKTQVTYNEGNPANFSVALDRLTNKTDTYIDNVHTLRDTYKADLVTLIVESGGSGTCGVAWVMNTVSPSFEAYGFNVVAQDCATGYYSFAHELGHNMGSRHDTYVDSSNTPYPYSHGYTYSAAGWRTIMAYNNACAAVGINCTRLQYWSNPNVTRSGVPMGNSTANNALSLNNTAATVAAFRTGSPPGPGSFNKSSPANGAVNQPSSLTLSWGSSTGATQYHVCVTQTVTSSGATCTNNLLTGASSWFNNGTGLSKSVASLAGDTRYYWQVRSYNGSASTYANGGTWWSFTTASSTTSNDDFNNPKLISSIAYQDTMDTSGATQAGDDPAVADCAGLPLKPGLASVWYRYTPGTTRYITVDTFGSNYDTYVAVWTGSRGSLAPVKCNDDNGGSVGVQSSVSFNAVAGTTYHIEVAQWNGYNFDKNQVAATNAVKPESNLQAPGGGNLQFHINYGTVDVTIGGTLRGSYFLSGRSISDNYEINGGPVRVFSTNGSNIFTSQRAFFGDSFNSIVGYPANQLTTEYWFTSYDDVGMVTYLIVGNPSTSQTAQVDVYIGGVKRNATPYSIPPGGRIFPRYGINSGPVRVVSTNGVNIFASERAKLGNSFNEVMGYPANQLTTDYWFTSYDDVGMITYLVVGNPHPTQTAQVDVYISNVKRNGTPYSISPGQRVFLRYGINGGPVRVVSTNGVNILTSERTKFGNTFNEVLGYPANRVTTQYWFTSYEDTGSGGNMTTYIVVGNPSSSQTAQVDIYIGGVKRNATPFSIAPRGRIFQRYTLFSGPVRVVSTNGVNIFASERTKYFNSFNEVLGIAHNQLTTDYWFTSYDDVGMFTRLVFAAP